MRLQSAYNEGDTRDMFKSAFHSLESEVYLTRFVDRTENVHDTFISLTDRMTNVFAAIRGIVIFPHELDKDAPDRNFATNRIARARQNYKGVYNKAAAIQADLENSTFVDPPILQDNTIFSVGRRKPEAVNIVYIERKQHRKKPTSKKLF
ncbi:hypothetical protein PHMEG_0009551 [Phytophthora megakarya]|uniref:Uncharacterized protein n=1 Tax=Phytophthora megakarya TaxID=4795 RepID=A0A225WHY4_9STRA|nr:hypothetical protein PHMEG_0009551 [Phytophthora megakarya]